MKKVINGKTYDTDKAILIGHAEQGDGMHDINYFSESLYMRPRAMDFFLAGEGGANTHWSERIGDNSWHGGAGLQVLDSADAYQWIYQHYGEAVAIRAWHLPCGSMIRCAHSLQADGDQLLADIRDEVVLAIKSHLM